MHPGPKFDFAAAEINVDPEDASILNAGQEADAAGAHSGACKTTQSSRRASATRS